MKISALLFSLLLLTPFHLSAQVSDRELLFLNWDDYMDPGLLKEFEAQSGIKIKQIYYDSDSARDELLLETEGKGFDLVIVNGRSVRILAKRGWLDEISEKEIPNIKHLDPLWRSAHPFAERFCVPYFWGTLGFAYRRDLVPHDFSSWMDLFQPHESLRGKIAMIDDATDVVGAALKALNFSLNSIDKDELEMAEELLRKQKPYVKTFRYIDLDSDSALLSGEIAMSMMYSGDALMVKELNDNIVYLLPKEGGNIWVDYICVLEGSINKHEAKNFINFLNEPDIAARLAQYVYYATPNREAKKLLPEDFLKNPIIYPDEETLSSSEAYKQLTPRAHKRRAAIFSRIAY